MTVDKVKTTHYYEELSIDSLCDCDYCRLYYSKSKAVYPELTDWLMQYGIDIEKPYETMWLDPDEKGIVNYLGVQYIVFGTCEEQFECVVGDIIIRRVHSFPTPVGIEGDFFVLEAYPICLSMER